MHLLNAAVAVAAALAGTVGATAAYAALNTTPVGQTAPMVEPLRLTHYLPCEPPSKLTDGVCVTTAVRTVVKTAAPIVITTMVEKSSSPKSKAKASTPAKAAARDNEDQEDEGDHGDEGDHKDAPGED